MSSKETDDLVNSIYRANYLLKNGGDPGDIVGEESGDEWVIFLAFITFGWLIWANYFSGS